MHTTGSWPSWYFRTTFGCQRGKNSIDIEPQSKARRVFGNQRELNSGRARQACKILMVHVTANTPSCGPLCGGISLSYGPLLITKVIQDHLGILVMMNSACDCQHLRVFP